MIKYSINGVDYNSYEFKPQELGKTHVITVDIENKYFYPVTLEEPWTTESELKIKSFPNKLESNNSGQVILEFIPSIDRESPCDCNWGFNKLVIG